MSQAGQLSSTRRSSSAASGTRSATSASGCRRSVPKTVREERERPAELPVEQPKYDPKELRDAAKVLSPFLMMLDEPTNPYARLVAKELCMTYFHLFHPGVHQNDVVKTYEGKYETSWNHQLWTEFWQYTEDQDNVKPWTSIKNSLTYFDETHRPAPNVGWPAEILQPLRTGRPCPASGGACPMDFSMFEKSDSCGRSNCSRSDSSPPDSCGRPDSFSRPDSFGRPNCSQPGSPSDDVYDHNKWKYAGGNYCVHGYDECDVCTSWHQAAGSDAPPDSKPRRNADAAECPAAAGSEPEPERTRQDVPPAEREAAGNDGAWSRELLRELEPNLHPVGVENHNSRIQNRYYLMAADKSWSPPDQRPTCSRYLQPETTTGCALQDTETDESDDGECCGGGAPLSREPRLVDISGDDNGGQAERHDDPANAVQCQANMVANAFANISYAEQDLQKKKQAYRLLKWKYLQFVKNPIEADQPCPTSPTAQQVLRAIYENPPRVLAPFDDSDVNANAFRDRDFVRLLPFYEIVLNHLEYASGKQREYGFDMLEDVMSALYHIHYDLGDPRLKNDVLTEHVRLVTRNTWEFYFYPEGRRMPRIPEPRAPEPDAPQHSPAKPQPQQEQVEPGRSRRRTSESDRSAPCRSRSTSGRRVVGPTLPPPPPPSRSPPRTARPGPKTPAYTRPTGRGRLDQSNASTAAGRRQSQSASSSNAPPPAENPGTSCAHLPIRPVGL